MKKIILLSLFALTSLASFAQLNVTGQATIAIQPEKTIINYSISETRDNYDDAIGTMVERIDQLTKSLIRIDFRKEDIKTSTFNIRQNRKYRQGEPNGVEYVASQTLEIQFDYSTDRLLEVLNRTTTPESSPSISIAFGMSEEQRKATKVKLMQLAVADAKAKAEILAQETGYAIKGIKEINYGNQNHQPRTSYASMGRMKAFAESDMSNFEAKDLVLNDQVFITYIIGE